MSQDDDTPTDDHALMAAFLAAVERLSDQEAAREVGLTGETVRQYRAGNWKRIFASTRRKIEDYLGRAPARESQEYGDALRFAADRIRALADELEALGSDRAVRSPASSPERAVEGEDAIAEAERRARERADAE